MDPNVIIGLCMIFVCFVSSITVAVYFIMKQPVYCNYNNEKPWTDGDRNTVINEINKETGKSVGYMQGKSNEELLSIVKSLC